MAGEAGNNPFGKTKTRQPDHVPFSKQPNSRPPNGFREKLLHTPLPFYSGPYSVGMLDIEVPAREPRAFSNITRDGKPLLQLETVLFSVFYPSGFGSGNGNAPDGEEKWSRATWLPRPRAQVAKGYAKFAGLPSSVTIAFFGITTSFTKLPAFRNAKLAEHWPPPHNSREKGFSIKNVAGEPPPGEAKNPIFPLLIFSHGLGGTRTTYSTVCGEFASYGFVVVSLEHRDGSGPRTFVNIPSSPKGEKKNRSREDQDRRYSRKDYIFPKDNPKDTMPGNKQGIDGQLRSAQIQLRLAEIEEAYHVMTLICAGKGDIVAAGSLRDKDQGYIGASSRGLKGVNWEAWAGRFHLQQVTMLGHSFGAATTVEVLRHKDRFEWVGQGIIYDIWGAAIQPPEDVPEHRISAPLLGINSEAFMYWPDNFSSLMSLGREAKEHDALCWLMTVRGTVHVSQSDFTLLYPRICSLILKMTANPRRAIDININASLEFLRQVMPARISAMNRGTNEHLLEVESLDDLPGGRQPPTKWTAVRLKIPHEMRIRLTPGWVRRYARRHKNEKLEHKERRKSLPKDPNGRVLVGLEDFEGDEIYMHIAPTKEELLRHGIKPRAAVEEATGRGEGEHEGIVDCDEEVGKGDGEDRGIERRYMERG